MSRLFTDARTECEDRARILRQNSQNEREIYLKYLGVDKMRGKVGKSERNAFNGA